MRQVLDVRSLPSDRLKITGQMFVFMCLSIIHRLLFAHVPIEVHVCAC